MKQFSTLLILLTFFTTSVAFSRGPAVEDFVGIEVEEPAHTTPQGTEVLFNFEKDMNNYQEQGQGVTVNTPNNPTVVSATNPETSYGMESSGWMGIAFILSMPLISWALVMNHLRRKAGAASANNIAVLDQYRKNRQQSKTENIKKAS